MESSPRLFLNMSIEEKLEISTSDEVSEFDFYSFHERYAGRLIIDPVYVYYQITNCNSPFSTFVEKPR